MITFNKSDFDTILEYAKSNLPEEACGLIGGTIENGDKHIKRYTFLLILTIPMSIFQWILRNS